MCIMKHARVTHWKAEQSMQGLRKTVAFLRQGLLRNHLKTCRPYALPMTTAVEGRLLLGFTCKICNERTHRTISRQAYSKGVVLVQCPCCQNRHLIADNLGWFEPRGKEDNNINIEETLKKRGEHVRTAWREDEQGAILECLEEVVRTEK